MPSISRNNCVVLDISILPRRPSVPDIRKFLDEELKMDWTSVKSLQLHNVKNVVYLSMHSEKAASDIASKFHLKHCMECDGKRIDIPLPVYVDSTAVDVRINDLPEEIDNLAIINHMSQYGNIFSIRNEVWKNYFPGLNNGVRVVRMQITKPIPSYITIADELTSVTHFQQVRTCKNCGDKLHPKLRCSEAAAKNNIQPRPISTPQPPVTTASKQQQKSNHDEQWPSLSKSDAASVKATAPKPSKSETKRQRSIDSDTANSSQITKKPASSASIASDSSVIVAPDVSPVRTRNRRSSYSWIEDVELRKQYMEEDDRRINELYAQGYRCN